MKTKSRHRRLIVFGLIAITAIVVLIGYQYIYSTRNFESLEDFSKVWLATPHEDRYELLEWLLGEAPARSADYPIEQTRVYGLTRDEIESHLGSGKSSSVRQGIVYYDVGSIETDVTGFFVPGFSKWDLLQIKYDDNGNLLNISTVS